MTSTPSKDTLQPVTTYALIGNRMDPENNNLILRGDCEFICADPALSLKEQFETLKMPANLILAAHGGDDGTFEWADDEHSPTYRAFFEALPQKGIYSILINGCFGGTVMDAAPYAPPGAIIHTAASASNIGLISYQWLRVEGDTTSAIDTYIENLDNFHPDYTKAMKHLNRSDKRRDNTDADKALPHVIAIGGEKGRVIDLDQTYSDLAAHPSIIDAQAMFRARDRIQSRFDTHQYHFNPKTKQDQYAYGSSKDEYKLMEKISNVAERLFLGHAPRSFEERRIALALTAAYLEETGDIAKAVRHAGGEIHPDVVKDPKFDAKGVLINPDDVYVESSAKNITEEEQIYLNSVKDFLKTDIQFTLQTDAILRQLKGAFAATEGNDAVNESLQQSLQKANISTKGWER